jgi:REP element-mobilizing transposase RayT
MEFHPGEMYHIYNRGNNRQKIFQERKNYLYFLGKIRNHLLKHSDILAWCLMPNHFHIMIRVHDDYDPNVMRASKHSSAPVVQPLNRSIAIMLSSYTKGFNKMYQRTGSLFQARTKSKVVHLENRRNRNYPLNCFIYIHQNPIRANLVDRLEDWEFSSYRDFATLRDGSLCNLTLARELLNLPTDLQEFRIFTEQTIPEHYRGILH